MKSKLPYLSNAHQKAIAHVSIRSAQLDHMIELLVLELLMPNINIAELLLKSWRQNQQVDLIQKVLLDRFPWYKADIEAFIASVREARGKRNDVIHYVWGKTDKSGAARLASYRPFREDVEKKMTAAEVGAVADTLLECVTKMHELSDWLRPQQPPLPNPLAHTLQQGASSWPLSRDHSGRRGEASPPSLLAQMIDPKPK